MYGNVLLDRECDIDYVALFERYLGPGKQSGKMIVFPCFRCDAGQSGKRHLYLEPMKGLYRCVKCASNADGYGSGNAFMFAKMMGETSNIMPTQDKRYERPNFFNQAVATRVYTYLCNQLTLSDEDAEECMAKRGLKRSNLSHFGLKSCLHASDILRSHFIESELLASGLFYRRDGRLVAQGSINESRVIIPYPDWETGEIPYIRSRGGNDGDKRKYLSPINNPSGQRVWGRFKEGATQIVITEGEFKAMASVQAGVLCVALPGMNSSHNTVCKYLNNSTIKKAVICFDTQLEGMENVEHAARALGRKIRNSVQINVSYAKLPLVPDVDGGRKMDIDTFLLHRSTEEFRDIIHAAERL